VKYIYCNTTYYVCVKHQSRCTCYIQFDIIFYHLRTARRTYRRRSSLWYTYNIALLLTQVCSINSVKDEKGQTKCNGYRRSAKRLIRCTFDRRKKKGCRRKRGGAAAVLADFSRTTTTTTRPPVRSTRVSRARTSLVDGRALRTLLRRPAVVCVSVSVLRHFSVCVCVYSPPRLGFQIMVNKICIYDCYNSYPKFPQIPWPPRHIDHHRIKMH